MSHQPNLLVILTDQHNPHVMGCAGDPVVRTPNLDRLASRGVRFTSTYCGSPLCAPSRMTFLTSRHCSDIEVWTNGCTLDSRIPTFAHGLNAAGYETVLCGRMHFNGPDQRHGFESRIVGDIGHAKRSLDTPLLGDIPRGTTGLGSDVVRYAGAGSTAYKAYDDVVTGVCREFLQARDRTPGDRPLALVLGLLLPHSPLICPPDLFEYYFDRIEMPVLPEGYVDSLHPAMKAHREFRGFDDLSADQARVAIAAYYGLVEYSDRLIGGVLDTLQAGRFCENTAVVYLSDHGDMAGEHGLWTKTTFYEGSVGVPMIWSFPGRFTEGRIVDQVTSLLDVGPTLMSLAGADCPDHLAGRSLLGFLEDTGKVPDWSNEAFSENEGRLGDRPSRMIRQGPWKLNHYHGYEQPQLFNLLEDPGEFNDLRDDPNCADVLSRLHRRVQEGWDGERIATAAADIDTRRKEQYATAEPFRTPVKDSWEMPPGCNLFGR
jgi:choline-sulfatase